MQRMLVGLVVFLTVVVAVLAVTTFNLYEEVNSRPRVRQAAAPTRTTAEEAARTARVESLEGRIDALLGQIGDLRREQARLRGALNAAASGATPPALPREDESGNDDPNNPASGFFTDPQRNPDGTFDFTEQDEEYFLALQKRVQRRQRIEGMTRNVMRRIERLAGQGEIQPILEENRFKVERVVRKYVVMGDDLITSYIREPTDDIKGMSSEEKREAMRDARETMVVQAQEELAPVMGEEDALRVAERTLQSYWGGRFSRRERPGLDRR